MILILAFLAATVEIFRICPVLADLVDYEEEPCTTVKHHEKLMRCSLTSWSALYSRVFALIILIIQLGNDMKSGSSQGTCFADRHTTPNPAKQSTKA